MTRRHFQALADALRGAYPIRTHQAEADAVWRACVKAVGDACYASNGRFDRSRFERACEGQR